MLENNVFILPLKQQMFMGQLDIRDQKLSLFLLLSLLKLESTDRLEAHHDSC